jgi:hypothetical protein
MAVGQDLIMASLASGVNSLANKPQKSSQVSMTMPIEVESLFNLRDRIGVERDLLDNALQKRNTWKYSLANALSGIQPQSYKGAYGVEVSNPWVGGIASALSSFGNTAKGMTDREIEQAKTMYDTALKDLQFEAEISKAMGTKQEDTIKYDETVRKPDDLSQQQLKTAQTAYIKLDPDLPKRIRDNKDAYGYMAREADLGSRTPEGGTTGAVERIMSSIAKAKVGDKTLGERSAGLQEMTQYVGAVTDLARQNGAAASMMNSDKEGQRALGILNNPATYSAEELASAAEQVLDLYNRMLAVAGMPSVEEGYKAVTKQVEQSSGGIDWSQYKE